MAVKIRLTRLGKVHAPSYRVVVADSRTRRDGPAIEQIGLYHPLEEPSFVEINSERAQYWLSVGAQPTDQVKALLKLTGDWQKFTGEGEAVNTVRGRAAKESFEAPAAKSVIVEKPTEAEKPADAGAEAPAETPAEGTDQAEA
ncbi:30S ribosomal protein S16 [Brevibacterium jeotgali]|uniref:Small ribosomal subunit protein bS16 n=1 Tax=Brevibacterium jeotgali TaxID=1262550 RepID=A0A2H1L2Y7_9MICO|nr:30S ribosomal protein S16 [Brevibacterium jeotgali]TWC02475.1 small subunit ribosomal protein S16 [Brevibacterium jeotgali]SMY11267.1 small subunit ribosomal protein S16 [Brevibacterium jeotgali]